MTTDTYKQIRRSRIMIVVFLLLTIASVITAFSFYLKLEKSNDRLRKNKTELEESIAQSKVLLDSIEVLSLDCPGANKEKIKAIALKSDQVFGNTKFGNAVKLEREAFIAIQNNNFDAAIRLLGEVEEVYPTFHQAYEIKRYLERNKELALTRKGQREIKRTIIDNYGWKAPEDIVYKLKREVGN